MTKIDIITEILENTYGANPSLRGMNGTAGCIYYNLGTGNKCAVGMCMNDEAIKEYGNFWGNVFNLENEITTIENAKEALKLDVLLQEKYHGHEVDFWVAMQRFHDQNSNFTESGLSDMGVNRLKELKEKYSL